MPEIGLLDEVRGTVQEIAAEIVAEIQPYLRSLLTGEQVQKMDLNQLLTATQNAGHRDGESQACPMCKALGPIVQDVMGAQNAY